MFSDNARLCIIPARGGSRRIPGKNKRDFHGRPIIDYSLEAAVDSQLFSDIIVSTDDPDIGQYAWYQYGAVIHARSERMAQDEVGTHAVALEVTKHYYQSRGWKAAERIKDHPIELCVLYPAIGTVTSRELRDAWLKWECSVMTALEREATPKEWMRFPMARAVGENGVDAGRWYFVDWKTLDDHVSNGVGLEYLDIPCELACDINTEEDWKRAEGMFK